MNDGCDFMSVIRKLLKRIIWSLIISSEIISFVDELLTWKRMILSSESIIWTIQKYRSGQLTFKISNIFSINLLFLVQCAVSHHHGARRSSNRNSFTFFRLHCLYVLTRWRAGLCIGGTLAEFLAGHIHNWLKSMALKTPSTKRYIGEIKGAKYFVFSPLVPSKGKKYILVLLSLYFFLREVCLLFNFWMIKFTIMFFFT